MPPSDTNNPAGPSTGDPRTITRQLNTLGELLKRMIRLAAKHKMPPPPPGFSNLASPTSNAQLPHALSAQAQADPTKRMRYSGGGGGGQFGPMFPGPGQEGMDGGMMGYQEPWGFDGGMRTSRKMTRGRHMFPMGPYYEEPRYPGELQGGWAPMPGWQEPEVLPPEVGLV